MPRIFLVYSLKEVVGRADINDCKGCEKQSVTTDNNGIPQTVRFARMREKQRNLPLCLADTVISVTRRFSREVGRYFGR